MSCAENQEWEGCGQGEQQGHCLAVMLLTSCLPVLVSPRTEHPKLGSDVLNCVPGKLLLWLLSVMWQKTGLTA